MNDWKETLASLGAAMPAPEEAPEGSAATATEEKPGQKGALRVVIDRKGRKGKTATIIEGFELPDEEVEAIASDLKRRIGTGGSARGGEILLQGDWQQRARELLSSMGYKVK